MKQSRDIFRFSFLFFQQPKARNYCSPYNFFFSHVCSIQHIYVYITLCMAEIFSWLRTVLYNNILSLSLLLTNLQYLGWRLRRHCCGTWGVTTPTIVSLLLQHSPNVNALDQEEMTAIACKEGSLSSSLPPRSTSIYKQQWTENKILWGFSTFQVSFS